ncbi:30S ribosomal protein S20 [bacterium]|nr:30S ribosomal protein S20 [bacterium]
MPQRRTAKKDLRQNKKRQQRNLEAKQSVKQAIKKLRKAVDSKDASTREKALAEVYKILDKTASKKIIHRNKASRKKSRLAKLLKKTTSESS